MELALNTIGFAYQSKYCSQKRSARIFDEYQGRVPILL